MFFRRNESIFLDGSCTWGIQVKFTDITMKFQLLVEKDSSFIYSTPLQAFLFNQWIRGNLYTKLTRI